MREDDQQQVQSWGTMRPDMPGYWWHCLPLQVQSKDSMTMAVSGGWMEANIHCSCSNLEAQCQTNIGSVCSRCHQSFQRLRLANRKNHASDTNESRNPVFRCRYQWGWIPLAGAIQGLSDGGSGRRGVLPGLQCDHLHHERGGRGPLDPPARRHHPEERPGHQEPERDPGRQGEHQPLHAGVCGGRILRNLYKSQYSPCRRGWWCCPHWVEYLWHS